MTKPRPLRAGEFLAIPRESFLDMQVGYSPIGFSEISCKAVERLKETT